MDTVVLTEYLQKAVEVGASDIFFIAGSPPAFRKDSIIVPLEGLAPLNINDTENITGEIYKLAKRPPDQLRKGDDDFSFSLPGVGRFRASAFKQRGSYAAVIRVFTFTLPDPQDLGIPQSIIELSALKKGLVLVTGSAGSGKSTTLACIIDHINKLTNSHIITMEDPIEFVHSHKKSIVTQREINSDTKSYSTALRAGLRQSPDVLLVGEMRDLETIEIAVTAAETGQLIFSTLHTVGAAKTIDRILDIFPAEKQAQIRLQLSMVLQAVVSQQLLPGIAGGLVPAFEIMFLTPAIRNLIREAKTYQLDSAIFSGSEHGMRTMDQSILSLCKSEMISPDTALQYCINLPEMQKKLDQLGIVCMV